MTENAPIEQLQDDFEDLQLRKNAITWALDNLSDWVPEFIEDNPNPKFDREAWDNLEDYEAFLADRLKWLKEAIKVEMDEEDSMRHRDGQPESNQDLANSM